MGASCGIFGDSEVAVMVTVVLLTTLITPLIMRGAFMIRSPFDEDEQAEESGARHEYSSGGKIQAET
jgi:hypothetical protein